MRFHITAALIAAATMLTGAVAEDAPTTQFTVTLTRTVQRVAATVTATRSASTLVATTATTPSTIVGINTPTQSSAASPALATGAAGALRLEMIGLAAAAGLAGFLI